MNGLDGILVVVALLAVAAGYRYGFIGRALSWVGLIAGIAIGVVFVDDIANALHGSTPQTRLVGSFAFLFLCAVVGQMVGIGLGAFVRRSVPTEGVLSRTDRIAGAVSGLTVVLIGVWLFIPAFANAPGWPARAVRGSAIVRAVDRLAPNPPGSLAALGRLVGDAPFPQVFDRLTTPDAGAPPGKGLAPAVLARVVGSVVKVEGRACDQIQQGSGFVATDELVVTNAHVVAGERATSVLTPDGRRLDATVVAFDGDRDLAILRVPNLDLAPLDQADPEVDTSGSVVGYPGGGPERESPARIAEQIEARGTNIYRTAETRRDVLVLAAALVPGDSGGALFNARGKVVGLAFAVDPSDANTSYALSRSEVDKGLNPVIKSGASAPVDTGVCLVG